ncbi:MAG: hypothetical protein EU530_08410 [Promethearchaeota archaeon]|nr:MAG: hypothetical protein EU530_08410 [Candidatus Lokiarchaeota archaeon]
MKPNLYGSLNAFSNKSRMEIIRLLAERGNPVVFNTLLKGLGYTPVNSSKLANHLKKLVEWRLVDKDSSSYTLTKLGKQLYDQIDGIEKTIDEYNRDIFVRTSDFCLEPFDETKIAINLMREADIAEGEAYELARMAKHKLLNAKIEYLTAPLIRESMNFILLESGKEEARHKLTRLGLPPYDVKQLLLHGNFENSNMLYNELGKNIMEQFLLLNLLPQRFADFYLSGKLFFLHPESWGLNPLEVVISGEKFSKILYQMCKEYEIAIPKANYALNQFLPLVINNLIEYLKNFFSGGVVITELERVLRNLCFDFDQPAEKILNLIFEMVPSAKIHHSHDERNIHSRIWEIWFEIDLNNMDEYGEEIELIISKYYNDTQQVINGELTTTLISKPNILMNCSPQFRTTLLNAKSYRDLSDFQKKIVEIALIHNISFISPLLPKNPKNIKRLITPHLNPITIDKDEKKSILILDKIYVNLPKIIEISEGFFQTKTTLNYRDSENDQRVFTANSKSKSGNKDSEKFLEILTEWICHAINLFDEKMGILSKNTSKLTNWGSISKMLFDIDLFEKRTDLIDYQGSTPIVCSISLNGLKEAVHYFTSFPPEMHSDSFNFLLRILFTVSNILKSNSKENGVSYVLSQNQLDNYLQMRYNQDLVLLKHMEEKTLHTENDILILDPTNAIYNYTVFNDHNIGNVKKLAHNFKRYQQDINLAFLNIFIRETIQKNKLHDAFKIMFKNNIHSFGFSQILKLSGNEYFRYAGPYKPLSYYDKTIRNLIQE